MLMQLLKKTITLLAIIEPFSVLPLYLATVEQLSSTAQRRYSQALGITVAVALLVSGFIGIAILDLMGVSLDGIRVGGGIITLILAIAMVIGKEKAVKQGAHDEAAAIKGQGHTVVPLGLPLLFGPACFAYMTVHSSITSVRGIVDIIVPSLLCGIAVYIVFEFGRKASRFMTPSALSIIEKLAGILLAGLAIDMIATGIAGFYPVLKGLPS